MRSIFALLTVAAITTIGPLTSAGAQVVDLANVVALRGYTGTATNVNIDGHTSANDGGGGQFVQNGTISGGQCISGDDDDGVVIVRSHSGESGRCWYRQFAGPVHLSWYGVVDAANPDVDCFDNGFTGCDATDWVKKALAAADQKAGLGGDGGVTTDGRSIATLGAAQLGCAGLTG